MSRFVFSLLFFDVLKQTLATLVVFENSAALSCCEASKTSPNCPLPRRRIDNA